MGEPVSRDDRRPSARDQGPRAASSTHPAQQSDTMIRRPRIVLYQPQQVNQRIGHQGSFDMLPLEMLHIAAIPVHRGYDVQIIDASLYSIEEGHRLALEAS